MTFLYFLSSLHMKHFKLPWLIIFSVFTIVEHKNLFCFVMSLNSWKWNLFPHFSGHLHPPLGPVPLPGQQSEGGHWARRIQEDRHQPWGALSHKHIICSIKFVDSKTALWHRDLWRHLRGLGQGGQHVWRVSRGWQMADCQAGNKGSRSFHSAQTRHYDKWEPKLNMISYVDSELGHRHKNHNLWVA